MSVQKYRITKSASGFTTFLNKVIKGLSLSGNLESLGLYVYLSHLPEAWEFDKKYLQQILKVGQHKLNKLLRILESFNLISQLQSRNEYGRFCITDIHVMDGENFSINNNVTPEGKNRNTVNRLTVINDNKRNTNKINNNKTNKDQESQKPKRVYTRFPSDFVISDENTALCLKRNIDISWIYEKFKNYAKGNGLRRFDWNAAFNKWILDEKPPHIFKTTETSPTPLTPQEIEIREEEYRNRVENHEPTLAEQWARKNNMPWN